MNFDVYADLDHLFMLNFSMDAEELKKLLPPPLRLLERGGRGFPSIVLPRIKRLRPVLSRFPRVDYELFGLRILVEYDSKFLGPLKGIYFAKLIMDPNPVRLAANLLTAFQFDRGRIRKAHGQDGRSSIDVRDAGGNQLLRAGVRASDDFPRELTEGSCFESAQDALKMYNDIAYGFLPLDAGRQVEVLQIADPHPNYVAWPLTHLEVEHVQVPLLAESRFNLEPSYHVGFLPRYWRWLKTERLEH